MFYSACSSILKLFTFFLSSAAEFSASCALFITSDEPFAIVTVFCAMFVVPAALSFEADEIPSIASVILVIDATSSSDVALKSDTSSLTFVASRL